MNQIFKSENLSFAVETGGARSHGEHGADSSVQDRSDLIGGIAQRLHERGVFLGGPIGTFEAHGRDQFIRLLQAGLKPDSKLLDFGCGCLRGGLWTIPFLQSECYFGVEPNLEMLSAGRDELESAGLFEGKSGWFNCEPDYNFGAFNSHFPGLKYDFIMLGSIWTHCPAWAVKCCLEGFVKHGADDGVMLALVQLTLGPSNPNSEWVGKSHVSDKPGIVGYRWMIWSNGRKPPVWN
jgi:hypothetical protein